MCMTRHLTRAAAALPCAAALGLDTKVVKKIP
jgi:hypothetical protein